ncbi:tRNA dihydrouridine(20/20a) synthase DusA [Pontivivens insulae]|uniref:tRNA-dihydrouridine(20/20a) synthase n=1 Tax=Pontivivens insulae TaxID=1639689 RepID=A0A2R8ABW4_9RHOB|nr:tRNA dihydrouridine(20/20a) synthase DusA [Pontivivens insulae]RED11242.1 tRNA-U16,U17-dihydrouridine synthase [Pontivivens insulae]SPF29585.1 tRNA-dihydrouridine(20/20a) synthase [Pontivivens insulae]
MSPNASDLPRAARLSVAPMMDWTDRHCRLFHRQFSKHALLYTEMVTAQAIRHGDPERLLGKSPDEGLVALQIGGSEPEVLAEAVRLAEPFDYPEINLNVGCPSDRVQSGAFGACLMRDPGLVAECVAAMRSAARSAEITVKCRIGVDEQDPHTVLPEFIARVAATGVGRFQIHARKAWLQGLSPKENRDIPPLDYPLVHQMKSYFPALHISINGGITSLEAAQPHLESLDGVMIGRAAYHEPAAILGAADRVIFGEDSAQERSAEDAVRAMYPHMERELMRGTRLNQMTRHMLGAFAGRRGARHWRRVLSEGAHLDGAGIVLIERALSEVERRAA